MSFSCCLLSSLDFLSVSLIRNNTFATDLLLMVETPAVELSPPIHILILRHDGLFSGEIMRLWWWEVVGKVQIIDNEVEVYRNIFFNVTLVQLKL